MLDDMVLIPGGAFSMGSDDYYPEERPARVEAVAEFWIDRAPVTNTVFARFVAETGYVTLAEQPPRSEDFPDVLPETLVAGAIVFTMPDGPVDLASPSWWRYLPGADWRHPTGPDSSLDGREDHPVVHVSYHDAEAFTAWAGKRLPTEAEGERAARGGLDGSVFAWGDEFAPCGRRMANTWQGTFPYHYKEGACWGTTPVGSFPPNGFGLSDMIGNVWEWTATSLDLEGTPNSRCCGMTARPASRTAKGGSYLCAPNYCTRYRPAARMGMPADTAIGHLGFRCARSV